MSFEIGTQVRIAGDYARTIFVIDSAPSPTNSYYVELPDHTQGFWVEENMLKVVPKISHTVHSLSFPWSREDARHYDKKSAHLRSIGA